MSEFLFWAGSVSGDKVELAMATLLLREHPDARHVSPARQPAVAGNDLGVDVIRTTAEGDELWQVKKFAQPLGKGQKKQVASSWRQFCRGSGLDESGAALPDAPFVRDVLRYRLVTPWTPTRTALKWFETLTRGATFECRWDALAYIEGLVAQHADVFDYALHGVNVVERRVQDLAQLAGAPPETVGEIPVLDSIARRQEALDGLRDLACDGYRIDPGLVSWSGEGLPLPLLGQGAVMHRLEFLGDTRWRYSSVVPLGDAEAEPLELKTEFQVPEGSAEAAAVMAWNEWGVPFTDVPALIEARGGPYAHGPQESLLTFVAVADGDGPSVFLRGTATDGTSLFRLPLAVLERTRGYETGWVRLVVDTPERSCRFELRMKSSGGGELRVRVGAGIAGRDPEAVADEIELLQRGAVDQLTFELAGGVRLLGAAAPLPEELRGKVWAVAKGLCALQAFSSKVMVMPDFAEVAAAQTDMLERLASIYSGEPVEGVWTSIEMEVPDDPAGIADARAMAARAQAGEGAIVITEVPVVRIGADEYRLTRAFAMTPASLQLAEGVDPHMLTAGDKYCIVPGADPRWHAGLLVED